MPFFTVEIHRPAVDDRGQTYRQTGVFWLGSDDLEDAHKTVRALCGSDPSWTTGSIVPGLHPLPGSEGGR